MPQIKSFTADLSPTGVPGGRRATGRDFLTDFSQDDPASSALVGEALSSFGAETLKISREIQANFERQDALEQYKQQALIRERAVAKLDELKKTGEPVTGPFKEFLQAELGKLKESARTRRGLALAEVSAANLSADLERSARASDVTLAGARAKEAGEQIKRSNGVTLQKDPDLFDGIVDSNRQFVEALDLQPVVKDALLRELNASAALSAGRGFLAKSAPVAKSIIESGRYDDFLDPDARAVLLAQADRQIKGDAAEARAQAAEARRQKAEAQQSNLLENMSLILSGEADKVDLTSLSANELISPAGIVGLYNLREKVATGPAIVTNPKVAADFLQRFGTANPPSVEEVLEQALAGQVADSDRDRWVEMARAGGTALKSVRRGAMKLAFSIVDPINSQISGLEPTPQARRALLEVDRKRFEEERKIIDAGGDPTEFYTDGRFEAMVRQTIQGKSLSERTGLPADLREGDVIDTPAGSFRYTGGDPNDFQNSYERVAPGTKSARDVGEDSDFSLGVAVFEVQQQVQEAINSASNRTSLTMGGRLVGAALNALNDASKEYEATLMRDRKIEAGEEVPEIGKAVRDNMSELFEYLAGLRTPGRAILPSDLEFLRELIYDTALKQREAIFQLEQSGTED